jgi:hypothetical protein
MTRNITVIAIADIRVPDRPLEGARSRVVASMSVLHHRRRFSLSSRRRSRKGPIRPTSIVCAPAKSQTSARSPLVCGGRRPISATPAGRCSSSEQLSQGERARFPCQRNVATSPLANCVCLESQGYIPARVGRRRSLAGAALRPCGFRLCRHNGCSSLLSTCEGFLQGLKFTRQHVDLARQSLRFCLIGRDRLLESLQLIKGLLQGCLHVVDRLSGWIRRSRFVLFYRNGFIDAQYDQENKG